MSNNVPNAVGGIPEFRITYDRYRQLSGPSLGGGYESMFYRILIWNYMITGIVINATYNAMLYQYIFKMYDTRKHVATAYMHMEDLNEFKLYGYTVGSTNKGAITASTISIPAATISADAISTNIINPKDKIMNKDNFSEYDADTIDAMIETLLQKKAALDDIESRWKKDEDFNDGDVIVVDYAYSDDDDAKVYTGALLKTQVGWFTTLTNTLLGVNKYSYIVRFFERIYVKKVTYLALSEGVEMFSNVDKGDQGDQD